MLVDAAKRGDVEIPVFCYEPKLGEPVGACRMCLVEVEGIPKLQTACSTPVRDGMVVYTQTDRVKEAQNAVVEFLLVNHPLDCPVCDKGGECPLQDIAMGWGPGRSRFSDPKRHFQKPIPLSPLVRIDRERCILCYRCVRFSQEVAEDEQLQLLERGAATYVGTFDDRPYIAPFHGNIIELCPVGALTSEAYRFRARPWDIEDAGSVCTLCPSQCNVKFTVRDEQVQRVLARDNHDVDDGWLCDKGRFGFQMMAAPDRITAPMVRRGGEPRARELGGGARRGRGRPARRGRAQRRDRRRRHLERGGLPRPADRARRARLAATSTRAPPAGPPASWRSALSEPGARPRLCPNRRRRRGARRRRPTRCTRCRSSTCACARRRAATASASRSPASARRPSTAAPRNPSATPPATPPPSSGPSPPSWATPTRRSRRPTASRAAEAAGVLRPEQDGRHLGRAHRPPGPEALDRPARDAPAALKLGADGAGLIEVPDAANARGLREAGCTPGAGPGFAEAPDGRDAAAIRDAPRRRRARRTDPGRTPTPSATTPASDRWEEALARTRFVVAFSMFEDESAKHADVVFPAESHAEKEGTVTHPDGRLQRVRPSVPHPGSPARLAGPRRARRPPRRRDRHRLGRGGARGTGDRSALLRRDHSGRDRRPRHPLAGAEAASEFPQPGHRDRGRSPDRV